MKILFFLLLAQPIFTCVVSYEADQIKIFGYEGDVMHHLMLENEYLLSYSVEHENYIKDTINFAKNSHQKIFVDWDKIINVPLIFNVDGQQKKIYQHWITLDQKNIQTIIFRGF